MPSSKSWIARHREGGIYSFVILLVAALACGGVVAGANFAGRDAFAAADARLDEAKGGAQRALLFPDATFEQVSAPAIEGLNSVYRTDGGAWVFDVSATGYHGDVELMVGIAADGTVAGIQIVAEDETDGIGTNALTEEYFGTFAGMPAAGALTLEDAGSDQTHVDGVSGATFTSNAVVGCLNIAFEAYAQLGGN
ncbi:FMN-binding protein [Candidatus Collinsella stercoripullorum]|uniref:FMN-binding protein n=1 Tax=Candidatus Collinsella stercoripullorum TaxID=2838522 RepID=UPI0022E62FBB|nr:FMN-binding protein [Candidatus Collinsella stercoripullorum]